MTFQTNLDLRQAGLGLPVQHQIKLNITIAIQTKWCKVFPGTNQVVWTTLKRPSENTAH